MSAGSPGSLPESVSVKAAQTITGDKTFSGTTTLSGTTALSGSVSGNISLSKESAHTVSVAASTTTDTAGGAPWNQSSTASRSAATPADALALVLKLKERGSNLVT